MLANKVSAMPCLLLQDATSTDAKDIVSCVWVCVSLCVCVCVCLSFSLLHASPCFENFENATLEDCGVQTDWQVILAPLSVAKPVVQKKDSN